MDKKYRKYSVEDFSQDPKFISWVKKGINQKEWKAFIKENPDLLNDIETARKIIEALRMGEATVSDTEVYTVWRNIELFYRLNHRSSRNIRLKKIMRYAAVFLVALMIGAAIPLIYFANNKHS